MSLVNKWEIVSKLISLENEYQFFKGSEFALDAEKMYRRICELEIGIGKTPGFDLVHCKDCKWYMMAPIDNVPYCSHESGYCGEHMGGMFFCACGERKNYER